MIYKLYKASGNKDAIIKIDENGSTISFLFDEDNYDYQNYLEWLKEGNTPLPADE